jgi:Mg-chelatase subunit ChlD
VVTFDNSEWADKDIKRTEISEVSPIEELDGNMKKDTSQDKLMNSVLENDKDTIDDGKVIMESINQGVGNFTPDLMLKSMVNNFNLAKQLYGEKIIRKLTGYSADYVEKNKNIPEFQREMKKNMSDNVENLKEKDLLTKNNTVSDDGLFLSSLVMYTEELDHLVSKGLGEKKKKEKEHYGDKEDYKNFSRSRYKDIAIRQTIKTAVRRQHQNITKDDLKVFEHKSQGHISVIYGLDSSGSMKGEKLATAKKAGVALAFKALQEKNKVGLIVFGSHIKESVAPTSNFMDLLRKLTCIKAGMETDIEQTIEKAVELFGNKKETKHLVLLTDAVPTKGKDPKKDTLKAASIARNAGITISIIGIELAERGLELAKKIVEIGEGRLYRIKNLDEIDTVILEDYYSL